MRRKRDESQMGISIKRKDPEQERLWMAEREQAWRRWEPYWKERTRDLGRVMDYLHGHYQVEPWTVEQVLAVDASQARRLERMEQDLTTTIPGVVQGVPAEALRFQFYRLYPLPGSLPVGEEDFLLLESCTGTFSLQSQQSNLLYGVLRVRQGIDQRQADSRSAAWMCYLSDLEYLEQQGLDVRALMP